MKIVGRTQAANASFDVIFFNAERGARRRDQKVVRACFLSSWSWPALIAVEFNKG